jgi:SNF2 family DNA or RNA helicase
MELFKKPEEKAEKKIPAILTATLVEHGDYIKIAYSSEEQKKGSYANVWEERTALRDLEYQWKEGIESQLGRMHFDDMGALLYPLIPGFENFSRATKVDTSSLMKEHITPVWTEDPIPQEEVIKKVISALKLESSTMITAKKALHTLFVEEAKNSPDVEEEEIKAADAEHTLNGMVESIFTDLNNMLRGYAQMRAKEFKLIRRRKHSKKEFTPFPQIVFEFKNGIEVRMEGQTAELFTLLLPSIQLIRERIELVRKFRNDGVNNGEFDYEVTGEMEPFEHQKVMYKIHDILPHSANLSQMGTGKSLAVLMSIDKRLQRGEVRPGHILIICPATLLETWVNRHIKKGTPHLKAQIMTGSYQERLEMILNRDKLGVDIFLTNPETFSMKAKVELGGRSAMMPLAPLFMLADWDMVVIDEAHKIKNPEAQRTQNIINTFKGIPYSIIMSGTINANKLYDLHSPFVFLNNAKNFSTLHFEHGTGVPLTLSALHEKFVGAYFDGKGYKKNPKTFTLKELRERMEEVSVRYEKSECFELPEKLYEQRLIEMDPVQAQLYTALKAFLIASLDDLAESGGTITIMNVLAMMVKLAEAANGWIYDDNHNLITLPTNPKKDAVMEVLDDLADTDKVILWSRFTNDLHTLYDAIRKEYGEESVAIIHGGETCSLCSSRKSDRYSIQERFNNLDDPLRFVVVNSAVGSHGIDLTGATYEFFYSNSFVKTDRTQAEDRAHRFGMRSSLTIVDFVMKDTVDVDVLMALKSWKSMTAALLGHLGINVEKLFKSAGEGSQEAPVVVEHIKQKPGECAITAIAMLSGKTTDFVRSWMNVQLGNGVKYKGEHSQILLMVEEFVPWMRDAWAAYLQNVEELKVSLAEVKIPPVGSGMAIIRHQKMKKVSHAIAFDNGIIFDPDRMSKTELRLYEEWVVSNGYSVEVVFKMPEDRAMVLPEEKCNNSLVAGYRK